MNLIDFLLQQMQATVKPRNEMNFIDNEKEARCIRCGDLQPETCSECGCPEVEHYITDDPERLWCKRCDAICRLEELSR